MSDNLELGLGALAGLLLLPVLAWLFRRATIEVEDEEAAVVTHFGKLVSVLRKPGLHVHFARLSPWTRVRHVSLRRDFRNIENVYINDARGTTLLVDLWVEFRIDDPEKALFSVADWNRSIVNLVSHAASSILGNREFISILEDRTELSQLVQRDISPETERWGVKVEFAFIRNVSLRPEVSQLIFESIAARLERAKADIDELGRIQVAKLEAATQVQVASLVAEAKGQYPLAVGRALGRLQAIPEVFDAYTQLHELSALRPHRLIAFRGFGKDELRAADAAMLAPPMIEGQPAMVLPPTSAGETIRSGA
jgi:regulator of protease activity HflC (stomatin/prohibitin superfamily)